MYDICNYGDNFTKAMLRVVRPKTSLKDLRETPQNGTAKGCPKLVLLATPVKNDQRSDYL